MSMNQNVSYKILANLLFYQTPSDIWVNRTHNSTLPTYRTIPQPKISWTLQGMEWWLARRDTGTCWTGWSRRGWAQRWGSVAIVSSHPQHCHLHPKYHHHPLLVIPIRQHHHPHQNGKGLETSKHKHSSNLYILSICDTEKSYNNKTINIQH